MPRADDLPALTIRRQEVPCTTNPLGVKGCGEAGAIGAPPAVINAILDALAPLGVRDIAMPATPHVVWRAIVEARRRNRDRKSTRLNCSHQCASRMPSSASKQKRRNTQRLTY